MGRDRRDLGELCVGLGGDIAEIFLTVEYRRRPRARIRSALSVRAGWGAQGLYFLKAPSDI